jgi:hypothetical protein
VNLAEQWNAIARGLDPKWGETRLALTVEDEAQVERAAALLGPANPGRSGRTLRFVVARRGAVGPEGVRRLLRRLDEEGIRGTLELVTVGEAPEEAVVVRRTLVEAWDEIVGVVPADWSDLYCKLELRSTDYLERAALLAAPLNPLRIDGEVAFRFRCARRFGYGASAPMVRRCLGRLDEESIRGGVSVFEALSNTEPVNTQGPVLHLGGRTL